MSYTKHNWVNGETITDTLLNHMEDGIANASGILVKYTLEYVNGEYDVSNCDKTFAEIKTAIENGLDVRAYTYYDSGVVVSRDYFCLASYDGSNIIFAQTTESGVFNIIHSENEGEETIQYVSPIN